MDFKQAPEVIQALKNRIKYEGFGYENPSTEYYNSIINWQKKRHGLHLEKEWIKKLKEKYTVDINKRTYRKLKKLVK